MIYKKQIWVAKCGKCLKEEVLGQHTNPRTVWNDDTWAEARSCEWAIREMLHRGWRVGTEEEGPALDMCLGCKAKLEEAPQG